MRVKVKHLFNTGQQVVERVASILLTPDTDETPMYWSYPVTFYGKSDGIEVTVTIESPFVTPDDVTITKTDKNISIDSQNYFDIAQILDDYLSEETR